MFKPEKWNKISDLSQKLPSNKLFSMLLSCYNYFYATLTCLHQGFLPAHFCSLIISSFWPSAAGHSNNYGQLIHTLLSLLCVNCEYNCTPIGENKCLILGQFKKNKTASVNPSRSLHHRGTKQHTAFQQQRVKTELHDWDCAITFWRCCISADFITFDRKILSGWCD